MVHRGRLIIGIIEPTAEAEGVVVVATSVVLLLKGELPERVGVSGHSHSFPWGGGLGQQRVWLELA